MCDVKILGRLVDPVHLFISKMKEFINLNRTHI